MPTGSTRVVSSSRCRHMWDRSRRCSSRRKPTPPEPPTLGGYDMHESYRSSGPPIVVPDDDDDPYRGAGGLLVLEFEQGPTDDSSTRECYKTRIPPCFGPVRDGDG